MASALIGLALLISLAWLPSGERPGALASAPSVDAPVANAAAGAPVAARTPRGADPPLSPPQTVRVGLIGSNSDAGFFIAQEKGYFHEQGIELEVFPFRSAQLMVAPLGSGELDVGGGASSADLVESVTGGVQIRVVADKGSLPRGFGYQGLVVRRDLIASGRFHGCADFRSLQVGISGLGTPQEPALDRALQDCGLSVGDVRLVAMSWPDQQVAFRERTLDTAISNEPFITSGIAEGLFSLYKRGDEYSPDLQLAVVLYGPQFIAQRRPVGERFMVAYLKGVRDYWDAFTRGNAHGEIVDILSRTTSVKDPALYDRMPPSGLNPDGYINMRALNDDIEWWARHGYVRHHVDAAAVVDNTFVDYAIEHLGSYVPR